MENDQHRRLVDFSLTKQDIQLGRTRHLCHLTEWDAEMAHQKKQFPAFQAVQKYTLDTTLHHDDDGGCDSAAASEREGVEHEKEDSGRKIHFLMKVPCRHRRHTLHTQHAVDAYKKYEWLAAMDGDKSRNHQRACRRLQPTRPNSPIRKTRHKVVTFDLLSSCKSATSRKSFNTI